MNNDLQKILKTRSIDLCHHEAINHLQELVLAGKISKDQVDSVLDLLDFSTFVDRIETIHDKYVHGFKTKDVGEYIANEFAVVYAIKDSIQDWKQQHLIPIIEFVTEIVD